MFNRASLIYALTLLLVVAHLHCLCHADVKPLHQRTFSADRSVPAYPDRHCDNEYGCICKGATLVVATDCPQPTLSDECLPLPFQELAPFGLAMIEIGHRPHDTKAAPLLSGRILRAHLSSLVI